MAAPLVKWVCKELTNLLGFENTEDVARYLLAMQSQADLEDYLRDLLDNSDPRTSKFMAELISRWRPPQDDKEIEGVQRRSTSAAIRASDTDAARESGAVASPEVPKNMEPSYKQPTVPPNFETNAMKTKPKTSYVPLYSKEGRAREVMMIPGRHACECQASSHKLVNNCLHCGRVVCEQEGSGPCLFCGELVCTNEEYEVLARNSKKSEKLRRELMQNTRSPLPTAAESAALGDVPASSTQKAIEHKNKLLEYDRTSARRTKVIDDESDYYSSDSRWLSNEERLAARQAEDRRHQQRHTVRRDRVVTIDIAGRRIVNADSRMDGDIAFCPTDGVQLPGQFQTAVSLVNAGAAAVTPKYVQVSADELRQATRRDAFADGTTHGRAKENGRTDQSGYNRVTDSKGPAPGVTSADDSRRVVRIQDRQLLEICDQGLCLSMHQPWASLLVKGIKRHEGRSWYTPHRGRLWIAATARTPDSNEVAQVESQYRQLGRLDDDVELRYPTGCVLGCVDVVDVLPKEVYQEQFRGTDEEESNSPFVFICESAVELPIKFPVKGHHKIYKLDGSVLRAARRAIHG